MLYSEQRTFGLPELRDIYNISIFDSNIFLNSSIVKTKHFPRIVIPQVCISATQNMLFKLDLYLEGLIAE